MILRKKKKNIIIIIWSLQIGGAERQSILLAKYLKKNPDYNPIVLGLDFVGNVIPLLNSLKIKWHYFPVELTNNSKQNNKLLFRFWWKVFKLKPYSIVSFTYLPNILGATIWRYTFAKSFLWGQRDIGRNFDNSKLEKKAIQNTPIFIANSHAGKDFLFNRFSISLDKIKVIPNGIETRIPSHSKEYWLNKLNLPSDAIVAIKIANLTTAKDHLTLIEVWDEIVNLKNYKNAYLLFAGYFGNNTDKVTASLKEKSIENNIILVDFVDDIFGLLSICRFAVFSSLKEGSPNGVLECMATGLPVIAIDIPAISEIFYPNRDLLIPKNNKEIFINTIIKIIEDEDLRTKVGIQNVSIIKNRYSIKKMINSYIELIENKSI